MSDLRNQEYFLRREQECREKAKTASDPGIRYLHLEFARNYARQAAREEFLPEVQTRLNIVHDDDPPMTVAG